MQSRCIDAKTQTGLIIINGGGHIKMTAFVNNY